MDITSKLLDKKDKNYDFIFPPIIYSI